MLDAWAHLRRLLADGHPWPPAERRRARSLLGLPDRPDAPPPALADPTTLQRLHGPGALIDAAAALWLGRPDAPTARRTLLRLADEQLARLAALRAALAPIEPNDPPPVAPEPPWHRYEATARATWFAARRASASSRPTAAAAAPEPRTNPPPVPRR